MYGGVGQGGGGGPSQYQLNVDMHSIEDSIGVCLLAPQLLTGSYSASNLKSCHLCCALCRHRLHRSDTAPHILTSDNRVQVKPPGVCCCAVHRPLVGGFDRDLHCTADCRILAFVVLDCEPRVLVG